MTIERSVTIRRLSTGSVFRLVVAGAFFSLVPFTLLMGIFALFGYSAVKWNNEPIYGIKGLLMSPLIGLVVATVFAAIGGLGMAFGLWFYSKFRQLTLRVIEDADDKPVV